MLPFFFFIAYCFVDRIACCEMLSAKRMLFILDLDRVLLHRVKTKLDKLQSEKHPYYSKAKFTVKGDHVHPRPGLYKFLKTLLDLGDVAVWTTSFSGYTGPLVMFTFHGLLNISVVRSRIQMIDMTIRTNKIVRKEVMKKTGPYNLQFVWGLNRCDVVSPILVNRSTELAPGEVLLPPAPVRFGELIKTDKKEVMYAKNDLQPEYIKNLDRVWEKFPQYTPENTLMIGADPKAQQMERYPLNNIVVPPFDVLDRYVNFPEDSCLPNLAALLQSHFAPPQSEVEAAAPAVVVLDGNEKGEVEGIEQQVATAAAAASAAAEEERPFDLQGFATAYQEMITQITNQNQ